MSTDAATQIAAAIPAAIPTVITPAHATPQAIRDAAVERLRATVPAGAATVVVPPIVVTAAPTAADLADASLAKANRLVARRRAEVASVTSAEGRAAAAESARTVAEGRATQAEAARVKAEDRAKLLADPVASARAAVEANSPEGRLAKLEADAEADRQQRAADARTQAGAASDATIRRGRAAYVAAAQEKVDDAHAFPNLARIAARNPRALAIQAEAINEEYRERTGKYAPMTELRAYQEWLYTPDGEAATEQAATVATAAPVIAPVAKAPKTATRTLAARTAAPATLPKSFNDMSPAEIREATIQDFRKVGAVKR